MITRSGNGSGEAAKTEPPGPILVLILSPAHSGSTLLDLLIGSHSQVVSGGELKGLRQLKARPRNPNGARRRKLDNPCTCGVIPARRCPFWLAVDAELGAEGFSLDQIPIDVPIDEAFAGSNRALLKAMAKVGGARFVVDSSKSLRRASRLRALSGLDVRVILLVRDPRGVVCSGLRKGRTWWSTTLEYAAYYRRARDVLRDTEPIVVGYESLATAPRATLQHIMARLGVELEEPQLDWRAHEHHNFAGNGMRRSKSSRIRIDTEWRKALSPLQKWLIARITAPALGWVQATRRRHREKP